MRKTIVVALIGAMAAGAMVGGATLAFAQGDVIAQRIQNRKDSGAEMRAIKGIIDAKGPTSGATKHAAKLKELEMAFVKMFPAPPAADAKTRALPAIWSDAAGWQAANKAHDDAIDKLAVAAGSGDLAALTVAHGDVGKSCGACHTKYQAKAP